MADFRRGLGCVLYFFFQFDINNNKDNSNNKF